MLQKVLFSNKNIQNKFQSTINYLYCISNTKTKTEITLVVFLPQTSSTKVFPFVRSTKLHFENHRACSTHGSSDSSQSLSPPPQWKHMVWSPLPENKSFRHQPMHNHLNKLAHRMNVMIGTLTYHNADCFKSENCVT